MDSFKNIPKENDNVNNSDEEDINIDEIIKNVSLNIQKNKKVKLMIMVLD